MYRNRYRQLDNVLRSSETFPEVLEKADTTFKLDFLRVKIICIKYNLICHRITRYKNESFPIITSCREIQI